MKRVLNSGTIKLPYIQGDENDVINSFSSTIIDSTQWSQDEISRMIVLEYPQYLEKVVFKFEIKAPLLVFNVMQKSHLGTSNLLDMATEDQEAYLPPVFYTLKGSTFNPMDSKICNDLNTKLNNFYNWSFNFYKKLLESGLCEEQSALALPQGLFSTFIWDVTAKDLITFIETNYNKSPEMFGYCSTFSLYLDDHLPLLSSWLKRNKWKDLL